MAEKNAGAAQENQRKTNGNKGLIIGVAAVMGLFICIYAGGIWYYSSHFLRGTRIGTLEVAGMTPEGVAESLEDYRLLVTGRDADGGEMEATIKGSAVKLRMENGDILPGILREQSCALWPFAKGEVYETEAFLTLDEERLGEVVSGLPGLNGSDTREPQDAYIERETKGKGFVIVPEQAGNTLNREKTLAAVDAAMKGMKESVSLEEAGCYEAPEVLADSEVLTGRLAALNRLAEVEIVYEFGSSRETLSGEQICEWITIDEGNEIHLDREQAAEYVASLRKKYDSIFRARDFKTSYGKTIRIEGGDYGWWMNYGEETEQLCEMILRGESGRRTPVYYQTAASYEKPDYGDTYVEINLTAQHMFYYENGELKLESDIVSGRPSAGNATPPGVYGITYKQRNATLVGETYQTPVSYWMPFNGNVGLHDASWQPVFGGNWYLTNGSHGCINLPPSVAKELYGLVEKGTPVICYELAGTEPQPQTGEQPEVEPQPEP